MNQVSNDKSQAKPDRARPYLNPYLAGVLLGMGAAKAVDAFEIMGVEAGIKAAGQAAAGPKPFVEIVGVLRDKFAR